MKHNLWCNPHACSPFHFSEIRLAGIIPFGTWPREKGNLNWLFVVLIVAIVIVIVFALVVAIEVIEVAMVVIKWWRKNSLDFGSVFYLPGTILNILYVLNCLILQLLFGVNTIFTFIRWLKKLGQFRIPRILPGKLAVTLWNSSCNSRILVPRGMENWTATLFYFFKHRTCCLVPNLEEGVGKEYLRIGIFKNK